MVVVVVHWRLTAAPSPQPKPPPDPPASLQRGIITEIDNVKNSFQKHFLNTRPHLVPRVKHEILSTSRAVGGWVEEIFKFFPISHRISQIAFEAVVKQVGI